MTARMHQVVNDIEQIRSCHESRKVLSYSELMVTGLELGLLKAYTGRPQLMFTIDPNITVIK